MTLIKKILTRMDELNTELSEDQVVPSLKEYLMDGVNKFMEGCDPDLLKPVVLGGAFVEEGWTYVPLPEDFLRMVEVVSDWDVPVTVAESTNHPDYALEANPYLGGGSKKPRVWKGIFTAKGNRGLMLKFKGKAKSVTIQKRLKNEKDINPRALDAISWYIAGDMFLMYGDVNRAKLCYEKV
jgi:hypothetical protein